MCPPSLDKKFIVKPKNKLNTYLFIDNTCKSEEKECQSKDNSNTSDKVGYLRNRYQRFHHNGVSSQPVINLPIISSNYHF